MLDQYFCDRWDVSNSVGFLQVDNLATVVLHFSGFGGEVVRVVWVMRYGGG